jgi:salicylate hydroxylase
MKKKIAIIGSGIAGLTLANLLNKNSTFEFRVYEKTQDHIIEEGYGIQLATNAIKILNQIDFNQVNQKKIYHPKMLDFYDLQNKKICELNFERFNTQDAKYTTLQRSTLIEFLRAKVYKEYLKFDKQIKEVSQLKDKILIKFNDNTNDLVDYAVVADGIFSSTRSFFEKKKNSPIFKKAIAIRTVISSKSELQVNEQNISLFMGANVHLVVYPINQNQELNLVCIVRTKKYDPENLQTLINEKVIAQNSNLKNLFQNKIKSFPLYATPKILPSSNQKVFYIGDAFNGLLPTFAQGAGQSIESAYELFNLLKKDNLNIANKYFKTRSQRIKVVRRRSNLNFLVFHISNAILQKIRNLILKFLIKRKGFIKNYLGAVYKI